LTAVVRLTEAEWMAEGRKRFGSNVFEWRFVCPACGNVAAVGDYRGRAPKGTSADVAFFNCIGRYTFDARPAFASGPGPCDYTSGGLFDISPIRVVTARGVVSAFAFDEVVVATPAPAKAAA